MERSNFAYKMFARACSRVGLQACVEISVRRVRAFCALKFINQALSVARWLVNVGGACVCIQKVCTNLKCDCVSSVR